MKACFVIGPAGSGKTRLCIDEAKQMLRSNPCGAPLVFLAPKQATYQIERQLLSGEGLEGYSRLQNSFISAAGTLGLCAIGTSRAVFIVG